MFKINLRPLLLGLGLLLLASATAFGQGTAFTYQGRLDDSGTPATGNYDFEFKLFDMAAVGNGTQQGLTVQRLNVSVAAGVFTVSLDFGVCANCFNGADRFLEISVKPISAGMFTTLGPRQPITSTPYALKSANATAADGLSVTCVNCVTSSQIQNVQGSQVTGNIAGSQINGAIPVASIPPGSGSYIQNGTSPQAMNFNISGTGTADIFNASMRYNLGGSPILSAAGTNNLFAGVGAGAANTGSSNAFFGRSAGQANTAGAQNAFFGHQAGLNNNLGTGNAFFGNQAGANNSVGGSNAFFGLFAGGLNTGGNSNSFFGESAGFTNTTGIQNTLIGASTNLGANNLMNATAIGHRAQVGQSHSLILGSINGVNGATTTVNVGIGTTTPTERLHVVGNGKFTGDLTASGTVSAAMVNATAHFGIAGLAVLSVNGPYNFAGLELTASNTFAGDSAGLNTTPDPSLTDSTGKHNSFFGAGAGKANTSGRTNSFFGRGAGRSNTTADDNSFFGSDAGRSNTTGDDNSFFGQGAGASNTMGNNNSFFGEVAGGGNTTGLRNSFFGASSGSANIAGNSNSFFGYFAGFNSTNSTGEENTLLGSSSRVNANLSNATAIGANAQVSQNNSLVLGSINGINNATADTNVGIGTTAPVDRLHVAGDIRVGTGTIGCVKDANGTVIAGACSSDARLKRNLAAFPNLLDKLTQLQPVNFYWRTEEFPDRHLGSSQSFGLVAQDVEKVMPELVSEDESGYKVVRYNKLPLMTIQAIKELKAENEALKMQSDALQRQNFSLEQRLAALETLVKRDHGPRRQ